MKWNESGFRPPLCTYRLNCARRTSWGWWDDWDDTVLQTQDSKFEPWRSEAEHATSRSRRLPTILTFTRGWWRNIFVSFKPQRPGTEPRTLAWKAAVLTTTLGPPPFCVQEKLFKQASAWCGNECWYQLISPYQRCSMHSLIKTAKSNWAVKRIGESERWADLTIRLLVKANSMSAIIAIRALAVCDRARYLSAKEAPHNIKTLNH